VDPEAAFRDEDFWAGRRIDTLSDRIRATYAFVDSLTRGNDLIDKALVWTEKLVNQSAVPLGPIDLNLGNMINISGQRGVFFGLGAFYRYGPYSFDNVWNNFAFKWSATFTM
jgi:hypothetical protein